MKVTVEFEDQTKVAFTRCRFSFNKYGLCIENLDSPSVGVYIAHHAWRVMLVEEENDAQTAGQQSNSIPEGNPTDGAAEQRQNAKFTDISTSVS